jgi:hypothetical protein
MSTAEFHKHDELDDLLALASDVTTAGPVVKRQGSAREAARALAGLASWVSSRVGVIRMQECMTDLARHTDAWRPGPGFMRDLPTQYNGFVDEHVAMVAIVSSSLAHCFGAANLRAGMAFWAVERDPAQWQAVVEA